MKVVIVCVLIVALLLVMIFRREQFYGVAPWDVDDCRLQCFESGQPRIPWNHGRVDGPWNDPSAQPNSTFDVAGCLQRCNR